MNFKDELRYFMSKTRLRKTILFSKKDDWVWPIRDLLQNYTPFFYDFNEIDLDRFDLVIPLTIRDAKYINAHCDYLKGTKALVPSNEVIDLCDNKEDFADFLITNGFPHVIPRINGDLRYPYILKRTIGENGDGVIVISDAETERMYVEELRSRDYFKQEYVDGGNEYTTHIIIHQKRVFFSKTFEFTFGERFFVKGRNYKPCSSRVVNHSHHDATFWKILNTLEYEGICCLNYKLQDNNVKLFEINPRYGYTMTHFVNEAVSTYNDILNKRIDLPLQNVA